MLTAVTVQQANVRVLAGTTVAASERCIAVRFEDGDVAAIPVKGEQLTLLYGGGARVLRLRACVTDIIGEQKALLEPQGPVTEGERREFLRAAATVRLWAEVVPEDTEIEEPGPSNADAQKWSETTVDLSGSGVKFTHPTVRVKKNEHLLIHMGLGNPVTSVVSAIGAVVRARPSKSSEGQLDIALHFTTVPELSRDRMINCVFRMYYKQLGNQFGTVIEPDM